ncbi:hypothetical protein BDY24DRAFT_368231 [Mrakia frigida]|uniref:uncharacterized protein n=1 Tax=Mrakia frigida TaxID=29902 RepID=UPI003FCC0929
MPIVSVSLSLVLGLLAALGASLPPLDVPSPLVLVEGAIARRKVSLSIYLPVRGRTLCRGNEVEKTTRCGLLRWTGWQLRRKQQRRVWWEENRVEESSTGPSREGETDEARAEDFSLFFLSVLCLISSESSYRSILRVQEHSAPRGDLPEDPQARLRLSSKHSRLSKTPARRLDFVPRRLSRIQSDLASTSLQLHLHLEGVRLEPLLQRQTWTSQR